MLSKGMHDIGDEAFMMAVKFNGKVPVYICSNRAKSAQLLENDVDILIMDDGLQNYTLKKDKSVVVFDGEFGIGNGFIIPVGFLRETFAFGMKKADVVVVMRNLCLMQKLLQNLLLNLRGKRLLHLQELEIQTSFLIR